MRSSMNTISGNSRTRLADAVRDLIDSHCHFDDAVFADGREAHWQRCNQSGIKRMLVPGLFPQQWSGLAPLCEHLDGVDFALGLHPWWVAKTKITSQALALELEQACERWSPIAVGECGLDRIRNESWDRQILFFRAQVELAVARDLPLIVHSVRSHADVDAVLREFPDSRGIVHGFSGSYEQAMTFHQRGFLLGIGGTISYERAKKTRDAVARLPLSAIVLETDAPDMPLAGFQGEANHPLRALDVLACLAELRKESAEDIAAQTSANYERLMGIGG